ncbi:uncharacterized protein EAE97_011786 [Botrytis byssoidea]|uniref:Uncharacterized protein n=1 Tax=Botrytis byssoidea TaxID=139641 RepID=A0A9P5HVN3_9HELO|nr:uncharacterized protein EAE97_011786 [Botrytis byssoidea]KAF7919070.1 hypothetical protein EAE97_011786 [Botrytis byssoidea]
MDSTLPSLVISIPVSNRRRETIRHACQSRVRMLSAFHKPPTESLLSAASTIPSQTLAYGDRS